MQEDKEVGGTRIEKDTGVGLGRAYRDTPLQRMKNPSPSPLPQGARVKEGAASGAPTALLTRYEASMHELVKIFVI